MAVVAVAEAPNGINHPNRHRKGLLRREFHEALLEADSFKDLPGRQRSWRQSRTGRTCGSSAVASSGSASRGRPGRSRGTRVGSVTLEAVGSQTPGPTTPVSLPLLENGVDFLAGVAPFWRTLERFRS